MKKLMMAMAAAAMACAANAEAGYSYQAYVKAYTEKDTKPDAANVGWYSYYGMTQDTARQLLGKDTAVDYNDVKTWLGNNFAENSDEVKNTAQGFTDFSGYHSEYGQYKFENYDLSDFETCDDYIGVVFFDNGSDLAYNVLPALTSMDSFVFDDDDDQGRPGSGWIAVPEPTSALLMLLGMAGLALKRKRA